VRTQRARAERRAAGEGGRGERKSNRACDRNSTTMEETFQEKKKKKAGSGGGFYTL